MKAFLHKLVGGKDIEAGPPDEDQLRRQVNALFGMLTELYGSDRLVLKAGKLHALQAMKSGEIEQQVLALQRLVFEDPTIDKVPSREELPQVLEEIQEEIADIIARRSVEDAIEKKIAEKMQERHEEYVREIRLQVIKESSGPESPHTLKKLALLEKMEQTKLAKTALEVLTPASLDEVVGQERAIRALLAKIASPYPQHVLLYGPPGVGKTTVARLVLEAAKRMKHTPFSPEAPFVEVDGSTLRWDPREATNPLLGSVHDPIYQGARRDLAEGGIPEPKLGLVSEAHGGVLFIDEIGELDPILQNKLLKVLEDKRVKFDSSYYDPTDPQVPKYIRKLFEEGAPADFVLIGATTRRPESISPAFRSRCAEIYFEPLTPEHVREITRRAAAKLDADVEERVHELISEYTNEGRKAIGLLADAYGLALQRSAGDRPRVTAQDALEVIQSSRLSPSVHVTAGQSPETGRIFAAAVSGFVGSILEIEAVTFPAAARGKGKVRFNETAGSMARDSVFNATSVIRRLTGKDLTDYDVHVNVVGGGLIDGPSAGLAITLCILSSLEGKPLRQDVAVTGEVSIQGKVKPVGGIYEKLYGARQAGMKLLLVPRENSKDVPPRLSGIEVALVSDVREAAAYVFAAAEEGER